MQSLCPVELTVGAMLQRKIQVLLIDVEGLLRDSLCALINRERTLRHETSRAENLLTLLEEAQVIYQSDLDRIRKELP